MKRGISGVLVGLFLSMMAWAADVAGRWKAQLEGQNGTRTIVFQFKTDGDKLTGTVSGLRDKELPVTEGKVAGDTVSFAVNSEWQGNPIKLVYQGKVSGGEIRFTMGTEDGGWSTELVAKRAQD